MILQFNSFNSGFHSQSGLGRHIDGHLVQAPTDTGSISWVKWGMVFTLQLELEVECIWWVFWGVASSPFGSNAFIPPAGADAVC